jgi:hypothetical protein
MTSQQTWLIVFVALILVGAGIAAGVVYFVHQPPAASTQLQVQLGDNVTVNYIGVYGSGPEQGKVFDTSLYSVAVNNIAFPKALTYSPRGAFPSNYTPLDVHVAPDTPSAGYTLGSYTFIGVVTGFWLGLVGLPGNVTKQLILPPDLAYGPSNPACVATQPLVYSIPKLVTMPASEFTAKYSGQVASTGAQFPDPHFGWPVLVLSSNSSFVTIENLPNVGWTASPAGWPVKVTNVSSTANGTGSITLQNELGPSQAGHVLGTDYAGTGPCSSSSSGKFIVTAVNLGAGTYTENFNQEVQGETLIFTVTVVDIFP